MNPKDALLPSVVLMLALAAGCSARQPAEFYQLQSSPHETAIGHAEDSVLLGPVRLADYLQREQLVQRQADDSLTLDSKARWAGSLDDEAGQFLLRELAAQLGNSHVALYPDRVGLQPQRQLVLNISRLDSGPEQPAVLDAQWRVLDANGRVCNSRVERLQESHAGNAASQVRSQSLLLGRLAQQLADSLESCRSR